jgi:hypothetical protein
MLKALKRSGHPLFVGSLMLALIQLSSCGSKDTTATTASAYDTLWTNVFDGKCKDCHGVTNNTKTFGGPDMRTKDTFYSNLVAKKGSDYPDWDTFQSVRSSCNTASFIAKGDATNSLVATIFQDSPTVPCVVKSHMTPEQSLTISADNLASLKSWINSGAAQ